MTRSASNEDALDTRNREASSEQTPLLGNSSDESATITPNDEPSTPSGPVQATCVAISLWILVFLQAFNMSGIVVIQGSIAHDLNSYEGVMWFTSAYLIAMSSLGPLAGRFASIFSPRVLVVPISICLSVGSLLCARAGTFSAFIIGRVLKGAGGSGLLALAIILALDMTTKKYRGVIMGLVNGTLSLGVALSGVIFGALHPVIGWRPLFAIQCPLSLVCGIILFYSIPIHPAESSTKSETATVWQKLRNIDYLGAFLLTLAIVTFLYALAGQIQPLLLLLSLVILLTFLAVEYFVAADPIIPLKVLGSRAILLSCLSQLGLLTARWTILFYSPIFMLAVLGQSRAAAGSILVPGNVGFTVGGILIGWLHIRRHASFWLACLVSTALFILLLGGLSLIAYPNTSVAAMVAVVLGSGLVTAAAVNYNLAHLLFHSPEDTQYVATSLLGTFRNFGGAFGTAIGGGIFSRVLLKSLTNGFLALDGGQPPVLSPERRRLVSQLLGAPELVFGGALTPEDRAVAVEAYAGASRFVWQMATVLGVVVLLVQAGTGWVGPEIEKDEDEIVQARATVMENEGVGEV